MLTSGVHKAAAYYAPKKDPEKPPESALDAHSIRVKVIIIAVCVCVELACYSYLLYYYDQACSRHYGAATCSYATDKVRSVRKCIVGSRILIMRPDRRTDRSARLLIDTTTPLAGNYQMQGWDESIFNTPGLRWIECYDTSGSALGTTLTEAMAVTDDDGAAYKDVRACSAFADNQGNAYDDDKFYNPDDCCNGWYDDDGCIPADFW